MGVAGCPGIPGRIKSVRVAGCYRYGWPDHPGIRSADRTIIVCRLDKVLGSLQRLLIGATYLFELLKIEVFQSLDAHTRSFRHPPDAI